MGDLTNNFSRREFACKCRCGFDDIDIELVRIAQAIRDEIGAEVRISSGCRCEAWNASPEVSGVKGSYHTTGKAADLVSPVGSAKIFAAAKKLFAEGIIPKLAYCKRYKKKNFVHIDVGKKRNSRFVEG